MALTVTPLFFIVTLSVVQLDRLKARLEELLTSDLHFGNSAMTALSRKLTDAYGAELISGDAGGLIANAHNGTSVEEKALVYALTVQALFADVLAGVLSPEFVGNLQFSAYALKTIAEGYGLQLDGYRLTWEELETVVKGGTRVLANIEDRHYVVITDVDAVAETVTFYENGYMRTKSIAEFSAKWFGVALIDGSAELYKRSATYADIDAMLDIVSDVFTFTAAGSSVQVLDINSDGVLYRLNGVISYFRLSQSLFEQYFFAGGFVYVSENQLEMLTSAGISLDAYNENEGLNANIRFVKINNITLKLAQESILRTAELLKIKGAGFFSKLFKKLKKLFKKLVRAIVKIARKSLQVLNKVLTTIFGKAIGGLLFSITTFHVRFIVNTADYLVEGGNFKGLMKMWGKMALEFVMLVVTVVVTVLVAIYAPQFLAALFEFVIVPILAPLLTLVSSFISSTAGALFGSAVGGAVSSGLTAFGSALAGALTGTAATSTASSAGGSLFSTVLNAYGLGSASASGGLAGLIQAFAPALAGGSSGGFFSIATNLLASRLIEEFVPSGAAQTILGVLIGGVSSFAQTGFGGIGRWIVQEAVQYGANVLQQMAVKKINKQAGDSQLGQFIAGLINPLLAASIGAAARSVSTGISDGVSAFRSAYSESLSRRGPPVNDDVSYASGAQEDFEEARRQLSTADKKEDGSYALSEADGITEFDARGNVGRKFGNLSDERFIDKIENLGNAVVREGRDAVRDASRIKVTLDDFLKDLRSDGIDIANEDVIQVLDAINDGTRSVGVVQVANIFDPILESRAGFGVETNSKFLGARKNIPLLKSLSVSGKAEISVQLTSSQRVLVDVKAKTDKLLFGNKVIDAFVSNFPGAQFSKTARLSIDLQRHNISSSTIYGADFLKTQFPLFPGKPEFKLEARKSNTNGFSAGGSFSFDIPGTYSDTKFAFRFGERNVSNIRTFLERITG